MSYSDAIDTLSSRPGEEGDDGHVPEGYSRDQTAALAAEAGPQRQLPRRRASNRNTSTRPSTAARTPRTSRASSSPTPSNVKPGAPAADLVQLQLQDFKRRIKGVDMSYAKSKNLTVYDVVTIASMVERRGPDRQGAAAGRRGHLQPAQGRDAARDRRDDALRDRQLRRAADRIGTGDRLAVQHPHQPRPAAGADRQPRPRLDRSGGAARQGQVTSSTWSSRAPAANTRFSTTEAEFEEDVAAYNDARDAAGGQSPDSCVMKRLAVLGHPVGHSRSPAMQNAALAELGLGGRVGLRGDRRLAGELRAAGASDAGGGVRRRQRHRPPQGGGAGAGRLALGDRPRDRRREHAQLRGRRDPRRQHRRRRPARRASVLARAGGSALVLGAGGAARAVVWALVREGADGRASGTEPSCARATSARNWAAGPTRSPTAPPTT